MNRRVSSPSPLKGERGEAVRLISGSLGASRCCHRWLFLLALCFLTLFAVVVGKSAPVTSLVQFSPPGGVYTNAIKVRLASNNAGAVIRYTLDGSEPAPASAAFSEPLVVTNSVLVKAKVFAPDAAAGPTVSQTYTLLDESLFGFNSNLPLVILNTFGGYVSHDSKTPVSATFIKPASNARSFLTGSPDFNGRGTLHLRGRSSLDYQKNSFTLHTKDDAGGALKVPLLGLPKESEWVLYAPYPDKTLMRDVLAYELSNNMGHYAPRTKFVELFVNRIGGKLSMRGYFGVYVLEEGIKRGKNRVNIAKLEPGDNSEPNITGGYIFKKDHNDKGKPGFMTSRGNYFFYVEPKPEELTPAQKGWLTSHLNKFEQALAGPEFKDPSRGYRAYIDVDSFIDHHWIVEMTKNVDGIRFSNFLHKDRGGKIKMEPIWDWNLSFGNASGKQGWAPQGWYWTQLPDDEYLWFGRLFEDPDFEQKYIDRWGALRTNIFATANVLGRVDELAALLNESQARNFRRWPILGRYVHPNWYVGQTYRDEIDWMKQWIRARLTWIDRQFLAAPSISVEKGPAESSGALALRASGKIYYTLDGSDPRAPGGAVSSKARLYETAIPLKEPVRIFARVWVRNRWSYPVTGTFKAK